MPRLNIVVPHHLSQEEALERIKGSILGEVKSRFADKISDLHEEWSGPIGRFSFSAMGLYVSGTLVVRPSEIELSCDLPLAAIFFKGKIESIIREGAESRLA